MNEIELAWAAGFFDGEGSTSLDRAQNRALVSINQNDPEVLERFMRAVGDVGTIYGPYAKPAANDTYRWAISGWQGSQAVVALLWKHLGTIKRAQAYRVMSTCRREHHTPFGFCRNGHEKTAKNTTNWGQCRTCMRESDRKRNPTRLRRPRRIPDNCPQGHALIDGNIGARGNCLTCTRKKDRARWQQVKAQRQAAAAARKIARMGQ